MMHHSGGFRCENAETFPGVIARSVSDKAMTIGRCLIVSTEKSPRRCARSWLQSAFFSYAARNILVALSITCATRSGEGAGAA
jgi:hypothetical protein